MKKYTLLALALIITFLSCKPKEVRIPDAIDDKRALLIKKQTELGEVNAHIKELQEAIEKQSPTKKEAKLVTIFTLKKEKFEHFIEVQSNVEATDLVFASSEMGGRILSMTMKEGQHVTKGDLIAIVDAQPISKQIEQTKNALVLARDVYERQGRLWKQKIGTEMQLLQSKNTAEQLEKTVELLEIQLQKANVYAPISGIIEHVLLEAGEMSGPGAPIVQILNPNKLKVVAQTPEIYTKSIRRGMKVKVVIPALDDLEFMAPVTLIGSSINPANRTFKVEVATSSRRGKLKPNLLSKIIIRDKVYPNVIVVPADLIRQDMTGKDYVMVYTEAEGNHHIAKRRIVDLGDSYNGRIIIKSGLSESDILIAEGGGSLVDGEQVEIPTK